VWFVSRCSVPKNPERGYTYQPEIKQLFSLF
jgi:hypothetical protein